MSAPEPSRSTSEQLRSLVSPQALLLAIISAAIAALIGRLTAYTYVAIAIFFGALAATAVLSRQKTTAAETTKRSLLTTVAILAAIVVAASLAIGIHGSLTKTAHERQRIVSGEERLVSSLSAGEDLARFSAALGSPTTRRPAEGYLIYQWDRSRETLQAVVNRLDEVISYAVYAKTPAFHPRFNHGYAVTLNTTNVDLGSDEFITGIAANAYCTAHKVGYFAGFEGDNAQELRSFVLGISDAQTAQISLVGICELLSPGDSLSECVGVPGNSLSASTYACFSKDPAGRKLLAALRASVYIETAPGEKLLPVMLYPPDEAAVLPS